MKTLKANFSNNENSLYRKLKTFQEKSCISESDFIKIGLINLIVTFSNEDGSITPDDFAVGIKAIKRTNSFWNFTGNKTGIGQNELEFLSHKFIEIKKEVKKSE